MTTKQQIDELRSLLGPAVLLSWPLGSKGTERKWKSLRQEHMTGPYLSQLAGGNIGVALGEVSDGLCAIDADQDSFATELAGSNPCLADTLTTHGARGRVFWLRLTDYPKRTIKLKDRDGADLGEFRSNGSQSIISGRHPSGVPYQFLVKRPAITIPFQDIVWPPMVANPPRVTQETQEDTEDSGGVGVRALPLSSPESPCVTPESPCVTGGGTGNFESLLDSCTVTALHTSHGKLLRLARLVLAMKQGGVVVSKAERQRLFGGWYDASRKFLRTEHTRDEYWFEFLECMKSARVPLGEDTITRAWRRATTEPPPAMALRYADPVRSLVALVVHLQAEVGPTNTFFLSCRTIQQLFGRADGGGHVAPARWLRGLVADGVLELVTTGLRPNASEYRIPAS